MRLQTIPTSATVTEVLCTCTVPCLPGLMMGWRRGTARDFGRKLPRDRMTPQKTDQILISALEMRAKRPLGIPRVFSPSSHWIYTRVAWGTSGGKS